MGAKTYSRPARLGALVGGLTEKDVVSLFSRKRILVRLEAGSSATSDARETFVFIVNQVLRFCPNVSICVGGASELIHTCRNLAARVHGSQRAIDVLADGLAIKFDATVNVGKEVLDDDTCATVNSTGWVARLATGQFGGRLIERDGSKYNPVGALAAGCLGAGAAFFAVLGRPLAVSREISLFTHESGAVGALAVGPDLPDFPIRLNGFLVGCGAVANGWAYAIQQLPIVGTLQAIDRQSLRLENIGPYVAVGRESVGERKAELIKRLLSPNIRVAARADQWEFFKIRLKNELSVPPLIIAGLDNVPTRHSVQRLWPETLVDMAAGGLESQVIVKNRDNDGQCILNALRASATDTDWAKDLARAAGLKYELIATNLTGEITQEEIDEAPLEKKSDLQLALGKPRCGYINQLTLDLENDDPDFTPAVPFVTAFTGIVGAAETLKYLSGKRYEHSLHYQRSFRSGFSRCLEMRCDRDCECQSVANAA